MVIKVRIRGFDRTLRKYRAMAKAGPGQSGRAVRLLGEAVATDVRASRPGAGIPKKTGTLARSISVDGPDNDQVVRLTAGGAAAPYALAQHERTDYAHRLGEARYWIRGLERAQSDDQPLKALAEVMAEVVRIGVVTG